MKITLVMATYNPNLLFLEEQLRSIENQTYKNKELLMLDDSSSSDKYVGICSVAKEVLIKTPYVIWRNKENLGSNKTFEKLVIEASGDYIGFCDQDDIYLSCKYEVLARLIEEEDSVLAYSDAKVIDASGKVVSDSFKNYARRIKHLYGENLGVEFIRRNCVTGCTMLVKRDVAKKALPIPDNRIFIHDHWIALVAASNGRIAYSEVPLISYRIHGNNQIGNTVLHGISDKKSYLDNKLQSELRKYKFVLESHMLFGSDALYEAAEHVKDVSSRIRFFEISNVKNFFQVLQFRKIDMELLVFEIALSMSPLILQRMLIDIARRRNAKV